MAEKFLSTPSARRATEYLLAVTGVTAISIHALCEEGDLDAAWRGIEDGRFLSTPSARRATSQWSFSQLYRYRFLSTPSARRATAVDDVTAGMTEFLSTPSARRATFQHDPALAGIVISIHALCEEGD